MIHIGTNYHPHDWPRERWAEDIRLMCDASFTIVRLGHLCWDSFEPSEGNFSFNWFDEVMDMMAAAGIQVVLDIATRPAPVWLHLKYPGIDIVDSSGIRMDAHTRYMEDVGNSAFREYAYRYAEALVLRYREHPALLAFGLCNELGAGFVSYSEGARKQFVIWLRNRYQSIGELNRAWAAHRWSRKLLSFEDVKFPVSGSVIGSPERMLDMRRFFSDVMVDYIRGLSEIVRRLAPHVSESTNHWSENPAAGFDYLSNSRQLFDIPGIGFYPGTNPEDHRSLLATCLLIDHRIGESGKPIWCLEFQTGTFGGYGAPKQAMRMYAYLAYLYRAQMICAWTWRTMLGGEEQYLFGLLDHDGMAGRKYLEFRQIAEESKIIEKYGLPRITTPSIAMAYSFESFQVTELNKSYYTSRYHDQLLETYEALFDLNLDCNMVHLNELTNLYKIILVPGHALMDTASADTIRSFVAGGGTVVMTAFSAKVNEYNQVFDIAQPGRLSDVFGIRANAFERANTHNPTENEGGLRKNVLNHSRENVTIVCNSVHLDGGVGYYERIEPLTAEIMAELDTGSERLPAVTVNRYGNGRAIYTAVPARSDLMTQILHELLPELGISVGPITPRGVAARQIADSTWLYVNTTGEKQTIQLPSTEVRGILSGYSQGENPELAPFGVEMYVMENKSQV